MLHWRIAKALVETTRTAVKLGISRLDSRFLHPDVPLARETSHAAHVEFLAQEFDREGFRVLEVGSREVTGASRMRKVFRKARYVGFDYYAGPNVDVVGDAHKLSQLVEGKFDLVYSSAVFEHLAMPWIASSEIARVLKPGGAVFVETHFSHSSHERPWHFFQFSDMALRVLFPPAMGFECIHAGLSNPIVGRFSRSADPDLRFKDVTGLYCHSSFYGRKVREVESFRWEDLDLQEVVAGTKYPEPS